MSRRWWRRRQSRRGGLVDGGRPTTGFQVRRRRLLFPSPSSLSLPLSNGADSRWGASARESLSLLPCATSRFLPRGEDQSNQKSKKNEETIPYRREERSIRFQDSSGEEGGRRGEVEGAKAVVENGDGFSIDPKKLVGGP